MLRYLMGFEPYSRSLDRYIAPVDWQTFARAEAEERDDAYNDELDGCDTIQHLGSSVPKSATCRDVKKLITGFAYTGSLYRTARTRPSVVIIDGGSWLDSTTAYLTNQIRKLGPDALQWCAFYDQFCELMRTIFASGSTTVCVCFDVPGLTAEGKSMTQRKRKKAHASRNSAAKLSRSGGSSAGGGGDDDEEGGGGEDADELDFDDVEEVPWTATSTRKQRLLLIEQIKQVELRVTDPGSQEYQALLARLQLLEQDLSMEEIFEQNDALTLADLAKVWKEKHVAKRGIVHNIVQSLRNRPPTYKASGRFNMQPGQRLIITGHNLTVEQLRPLFEDRATRRRMPPVFEDINGQCYGRDAQLQDTIARCMPLCFFRGSFGTTLGPLGYNAEARQPTCRMRGRVRDWLGTAFDRYQELGEVDNEMIEAASEKEQPHRYLKLTTVPALISFLGEADYQMVFLARRMYEWGLGSDIEILSDDSDMIWLTAMMLFQKYIRRGLLRMPDIFLNQIKPGSLKPAAICHVNSYIASLDSWLALQRSQADSANANASSQDYGDGQANASSREMDAAVDELRSKHPELTLVQARAQVAQYFERRWTLMFAPTQPSVAQGNSKRGPMHAMASDVETDRSHEMVDELWEQRDRELDPEREASSDAAAATAASDTRDRVRQVSGTLPDWVHYMALMMLVGNDVARPWPRLGFAKFHAAFLCLYKYGNRLEEQWRIVRGADEPFGRGLVFDVPNVMRLICCAYAHANIQAFPGQGDDRERVIAEMDERAIARHLETSALKSGETHREAMAQVRRWKTWLQLGEKPQLSQWPHASRPASLPKLRSALIKLLPPVAFLLQALRPHNSYLHTVSSAGCRSIRFAPADRSGYCRRPDTGELHFNLGFPYHPLVRE